VHDHSHAVGVTCVGCGAYWLPAGVPEALRAAAAAWELETTEDRRRQGERCPAVLRTALLRRLIDEPPERPRKGNRRRIGRPRGSGAGTVILEAIARAEK